MISKEKLLKHIEKFPEEMSLEELIERLILVEKLKKRIEESEKTGSDFRGSVEKRDGGMVQVNLLKLI